MRIVRIVFRVRCESKPHLDAFVRCLGMFYFRIYDWIHDFEIVARSEE